MADQRGSACGVSRGASDIPRRVERSGHLDACKVDGSCRRARFELLFTDKNNQLQSDDSRLTRQSSPQGVDGWDMGRPESSQSFLYRGQRKGKSLKARFIRLWSLSRGFVCLLDGQHAKTAPEKPGKSVESKRGGGWSNNADK